MKLVSFINYKGEVGKTTLASDIAADLALMGKKGIIYRVSATGKSYIFIL